MCVSPGICKYESKWISKNIRTYCSEVLCLAHIESQPNSQISVLLVVFMIMNRVSKRHVYRASTTLALCLLFAFCVARALQRTLTMNIEYEFLIKYLKLFYYDLSILLVKMSSASQIVNTVQCLLSLIWPGLINNNACFAQTF